jgi:hypothetical protein
MTPPVPTSMHREHLLLNLILGHKVAAAVVAITIGGTGAAAAGAVPFLEHEGVPVEEVDPDETTETIVADDEPSADVTVQDEAAGAEEAEGDTEDAVEDAPEVESEEARFEPPVDEDGDPYGDVDCDEARNHGEYVSSVAHDDSIPGPRGRVISQAARTDCGRDAPELGEDVDGEAADELDEVDATEESDDEQAVESVGPGNEQPAEAEGKGKGRGEGNGEGHERAAGNGRGNGRG